jgi:hypothetical protein
MATANKTEKKHLSRERKKDFEARGQQHFKKLKHVT